jgi:hypothetical protein
VLKLVAYFLPEGLFHRSQFDQNDDITRQHQQNKPRDQNKRIKSNGAQGKRLTDGLLHDFGELRHM